MSDSNVMPTSTGGDLWIELKSGYVYCFLPSGKAKGGQIHAYSQKPKLLDDYTFKLRRGALIGRSCVSVGWSVGLSSVF